MTLRVLAGAALVALTGAGCKDVATTGPNNSPSNVIFPLHNVSYSAQVQILFNQACNTSACHGDGTHQSTLVLTSYTSTVSTSLPGVVVPGKPDQSRLVLRIQGTVGNVMPPGAYQLDQSQINGIRTWIAEGAKNN